VAAYYQDTWGEGIGSVQVAVWARGSPILFRRWNPNFHCNVSSLLHAAISDGRIPYDARRWRTAKPMVCRLDDASKLKPRIQARNPGKQSMKVRLNLATNPLQTHRKFLAVSGLIGAIAALLFSRSAGTCIRAQVE